MKPMTKVSMAVWSRALAYGKFAGKGISGFSIRYNGSLYCWRTDAGFEGPWKVEE